MKAAARALWTLLTQLFLGLIGQPVPGQSRSERERTLRQQERPEPGRVGPLAALGTLAREALYGLIAQPSPGEKEDRSASSRRKPRS